MLPVDADPPIADPAPTTVPLTIALVPDKLLTSYDHILILTIDNASDSVPSPDNSPIDTTDHAPNNINQSLINTSKQEALLRSPHQDRTRLIERREARVEILRQSTHSNQCQLKDKMINLKETLTFR